MVPTIFWGSGGRIWLRCVAWKAAMRVDLGTAERWRAGRRWWATDRVEDVVKVESMRGAAKTCLAREGRMREAIS